MEEKFSWDSLLTHSVPDWMREAKFGIYTHWGVYAVPAYGPNVTWYPYHMYRIGSDTYRYHCEHFGNPSKFGYKDFIPLFTGEKFDPDEWAEIFADAGAKFAGPVAEHHDGFSMWDSQINPWNSAKMGPKRDVVGELEHSIRQQGMKFMTALHHAENWKFYPHWIREFDTADPAYAGLYGEPHNPELGRYYYREDGRLKTAADMENPESVALFGEEAPPSRAFLETWLAKTKEVIDRFMPDMIWFDFGLEFVPESYKIRFLRYYYEQAAAHGIDPLVTYKHHDLPVGAGMVDLELGRYDDLTYMEWLTDTTVDDGQAWGYMHSASYKTTRTLVQYLVDNVSKNGYLLLNVGPTAQGEIPPEAKEVLAGIGRWLRINGEAVYGTRPWVTYGQGPTRLASSGSFNEGSTPQYTAQDIRFTVRGENLYAAVLAWPGTETVIRNLPLCFSVEEIDSISMLGSREPIVWKMENRDLYLSCPHEKPCEDVFVYRIRRKNP